MKRVIITIAVLFTLLFAGKSQTLQKFFDKYADDERFEYVVINKGMINMVGLFGENNKEDKNVKQKMKGLKILSLDAADDSNVMKQVTTEMKQILSSGKFESAVEVREKGEKVNIYYRVVEDKNADMLIVTKEKGEFNCIWINGDMTKKEMMKTFSQKNID